MRIASLLPSATEIVYALGLGDEVVATTHECDFPPEAEAKPHVTRSLLPAGAPSAQIDQAVAASTVAAHSVYELDVDGLVRLQPDLILTQDLCRVCAVPRSSVDKAAARLGPAAQVLSLDPSTLGEVLADIERVGRATGREEAARSLVTELRERIEAVRSALQGVRMRPRVFCCEWFDPIYCAGHWVPEQVRLAEGDDHLGCEAQPSIVIDWEAVRAEAPEVVVLMPCGFDAAQAAERIDELARRPGWAALPAVATREVYAVDASSYFSRPGPRLVDGLEILARILHPEAFAKPAPEGAVLKLVSPPAGTSTVANWATRFEPYR